MKFGLLDADVAKDSDLAPAAKIVYEYCEASETTRQDNAIHRERPSQR